MQDNENSELVAAIEREQTRRQLAFSSTLLPVGGAWVQQFTPAHWVALGLVRSPFLGGDRGSPFSTVSVLEFLWICSPSYRQNSFWRQLWFYVRHVRTIQPATAAGIFGYLDAAFMDAPPSSGGLDRRSYYAGVTALCDFFACEYGWDDSVIMSKPLARLFQYFNCARKRKDPAAVMFNPSDKVRGQILHHRSANG